MISKKQRIAKRKYAKSSQHIISSIEQMINNEQSNYTSDELNFDGISMPKISYFASMGFSAPTNQDVWRKAINNANMGKQVLLQQVQMTIKRSEDIMNTNPNYQELRQYLDVSVTKFTGFDPIKEKIDSLQYHNLSNHRALMVMFGDWGGFSLGTLLEHLKDNNTAIQMIPKTGIIGIGGGEDNWGWLSTAFVNRTMGYTYTAKTSHDIPKNGQMDEVIDFLNSPWLIMLLVSQHHNITHPKVISYPLGIAPGMASSIIKAREYVLENDIRVNKLISTIGSNWGIRPILLECVRERIGEYY